MKILDPHDEAWCSSIQYREFSSDFMENDFEGRRDPIPWKIDSYMSAQNALTTCAIYTLIWLLE